MNKNGFNKKYEKENLDMIAFPLGGIGAGMFAISGSGMLSNFSVRNEPNVNLEPNIYAAISIKSQTANTLRILEGQVPRSKVFGGTGKLTQGPGNGLHGKNYGLPRFKESTFENKFPFALLELKDKDLPIQANVSAWSPFNPPNADDSSYPISILEYTLTNTSQDTIEGVFYFNSLNFMKIGKNGGVRRIKNGYVLEQYQDEEKPWIKGDFAIFCDSDAKVNTALFRGGWFDTDTMLLNDMLMAKSEDKCYEEGDITQSPGASLSVEFSLKPNETHTFNINCCWYVPDSSLRWNEEKEEHCGCECECKKKTDLPRHKPWYSSKFKGVDELLSFINTDKFRLREASKKFSDTFFSQTIPDEVIEAVSANLAIIKSPTILRQTDGRLWCWEGCCDCEGCCTGSCTHVWNYAQALCNLFPSLERSLRQTEFNECQSQDGHQRFRASLPIQPSDHEFHAAADGQLGGIMKLYRDYLILGDVSFLHEYYDKAKCSLDYCISTWDKKREGALIEPHHNTYDIEFWGADGMCTSFYAGALKAMVEISKATNQPYDVYEELYIKSKCYLEETLYNGEFFIQNTQWEGVTDYVNSNVNASEDDASLIDAANIEREYGPKYQYGTGCISDGILGCWMAKICGLGDILDTKKMISHLKAIHKYNLKLDLRNHANPQRPGYALGDEGGLLLCTWPNGGKPLLPFVYSDEVWTGIEYQVASHLILMGEVEKGLEIVKACRERYDGAKRNPFDEYECGHWYARAMASYALIESLSGVRYDAVQKKVTYNPKLKGDFTSFIATNTGYGLAGIKDGNPFLTVVSGSIQT